MNMQSAVDEHAAATVGEALVAGRIETLQAAARALAAVLDLGPTDMTAAAVGRLQAVLAELDQLGAQAQKGSVADELKAKRDRRAVRNDPAPATRRSQSRRRGGSNRAG